MPSKKNRDRWQYGDFQTPPELAREVCELLRDCGIAPDSVLEPTCGQGAFLVAVSSVFPECRDLIGIEINASYAKAARIALGGKARILNENVFGVEFGKLPEVNAGRCLVLGNPPWVTNSDLGALGSSNVPVKGNVEGLRGLDAMTGRSNFDVSEWLIERQIDWLEGRGGWIAMLVKVSVARRVLRKAWRAGKDVGTAAIYRIDANHWFGAAVDAALLVVPVGFGNRSRACDVFENLASPKRNRRFALRDGMLVSDESVYRRHRRLLGDTREQVWRSGIKHDCSRVMELRRGDCGDYVNGLGETVDVEREHLFPMLKSADIANSRTVGDRWMVVPQRRLDDDTSRIERSAPKTWAYLNAHAEALDRRGSAIYRGKPRFAVFGVGDYAFAPWKVAISGFYKDPRFIAVGPRESVPSVFDDTVYFLPFESKSAARFVADLANSEPCQALLRSLTFESDKRPVTAEILGRVSLSRVAEELGQMDRYLECVGPGGAPHGQRQLDMDLAEA